MANENRLIDANALLEKAYWRGERATVDNPYPIGEEVVDVSDIENAPTVDAVEVVRCKDCKHYNVFRLECHNGRMNGWIGIDGFCSNGERKDNERKTD